MSAITRRAFVSALALAVGCGGAPVFVGGRKTDPRAIDADPLAVLPAGIVLLTYLDLQAAFRSSIGGDIATLVQTFVPLGADSNFSPSRDTTRFYGGLYGMQGIDYCAVMQGRFDVGSMARAADARAAAGGTTPLVKTRYADSDIYTIENSGFALLTQSTLLCGSETGMRRALDRLRRTTIERAVPRWMTDLTTSPQANIAIAGDFGASTLAAPNGYGRAIVGLEDGPAAATPALDMAAARFPFLSGLRVLRAQGAFVPSGMSLVGALTYDTDARAQAGASALARVGDQNPLINLLMSIGLGATIQNPDVAQRGRDVAFVEPVDQALLRAMLGYVMRR